jgi:RimJ/RimL family protein N-acetyltransferase
VDEPLLGAAITESLEHLRPWMPWAHQEPIDPEARVQLLRKFRGDFDTDRDFIYGIFNLDESAVVGGTGLHPRIGEGAREIGYWIRSSQVNRGYAMEATAALAYVAFQVDGIRRIEVRCDPHNHASAAVPRKLGFTYEGTLRGQARGVNGEARDTMVWSLLATDPPGPLAGIEVTAFDACGARLL